MPVGQQQEEKKKIEEKNWEDQQRLAEQFIGQQQLAVREEEPREEKQQSSTAVAPPPARQLVATQSRVFKLGDFNQSPASIVGREQWVVASAPQGGGLPMPRRETVRAVANQSEIFYGQFSRLDNRSGFSFGDRLIQECVTEAVLLHESQIKVRRSRANWYTALTLASFAVTVPFAMILSPFSLISGGFTLFFGIAAEKNITALKQLRSINDYLRECEFKLGRYLLGGRAEIAPSSEADALFCIQLRELVVNLDKNRVDARCSILLKAISEILKTNLGMRELFSYVSTRRLICDKVREIYNMPKPYCSRLKFYNKEDMFQKCCEKSNFLIEPAPAVDHQPSLLPRQVA